MTTEQQQLFELLKTFSAICQEHNLRYFLVGGTLLGAVRHRGFIPWDDDIDVAMPEEDYQRFLALKDALPEGLAVQAQETDPRYPFLFAKLCDTRIPYDTAMAYGPLGPYIDIFSLVPTKKNSAGTRTAFNTVKVIDYILQIRSGWTKNIPYKNPVAKLGFRALGCCSTRMLKRMQAHLVQSIRTTKPGAHLCSLGGAYKADKEILPGAWFAQPVPLVFEGAEFSAPCGWHDYLTRNYGDYMTLPSPEQQISRHK